jgi:hypothetical protein
LWCITGKDEQDFNKATNKYSCDELTSGNILGGEVVVSLVEKVCVLQEKTKQFSHLFNGEKFYTLANVTLRIGT